MAENASDTFHLRCPSCNGPLICIGSREVRMGEGDFHRRHAYWCQAHCRGPEPDGTFELVECPACVSCDTSTARADGQEELECRTCGTITRFDVDQVEGA